MQAGLKQQAAQQKLRKKILRRKRFASAEESQLLDFMLANQHAQSPAILSAKTIDPEKLHALMQKWRKVDADAFDQLLSEDAKSANMQWRQQQLRAKMQKKMAKLLPHLAEEKAALAILAGQSDALTVQQWLEDSRKRTLLSSAYWRWLQVDAEAAVRSAPDAVAAAFADVADDFIDRPIGIGVSTKLSPANGGAWAGLSLIGMLLWLILKYVAADY